MEMYYADNHDVVQPTFLKGAVKEFYHNFEYPLYKEKKIPQDAEVYNMTRSTGNKIFCVSNKNCGSFNEFVRP